MTFPITSAKRSCEMPTSFIESADSISSLRTKERNSSCNRSNSKRETVLTGYVPIHSLGLLWKRDNRHTELMQRTTTLHTSSLFLKPHYILLLGAEQLLLAYLPQTSLSNVGKGLRVQIHGSEHLHTRETKTITKATFWESAVRRTHTSHSSQTGQDRKESER